ncbi:MAG TPA: hypothetical protein VFQ45_19155 [Longimicrobium sp.]|nr:hypothetical protein [Longimicrobium sp.]
MWRDPIVEEVHRIRERMWEECGRDLNLLMQRMNEEYEAYLAEKLARAERAGSGKAADASPNDAKA